MYFERYGKMFLADVPLLHDRAFFEALRPRRPEPIPPAPRRSAADVRHGGPGSPPVLRVCFVCTGNICRSPMADVVLRAVAAATPSVDGDRPRRPRGGGQRRHRQLARRRADGPGAAAALAAGYPDHGHRARAFEAAWLDEPDLVVALARTTADPGRPGPPPRRGATDRDDWCCCAPSTGGRRLVDVPDPYYGDAGDFEACLAMVEAGCRGLADDLAGRVAADPPAQPARRLGGGPNATSDSAS